jgi:hypothetical protein
VSPRATYQYEVFVEVESLPGEFYSYIRLCWDREGREVTRCMASFEIEVAGRVYQPVRYDTDDGGFHRHHAGFPGPSEERTFLPNVPPNERPAYAAADIKRNREAWMRLVLENVRLPIEELADEERD